MKAARETAHLSTGRIVVIILTVIVILLVPAFLFKIMTGSLIDDVTGTISKQYSQDLNEQMSTHIYVSMDDHFSHMDILFSVLPSIDDLNEQKLESFIAGVQSREGISFLAFADDEGVVYTADGSFLGTMSINMLGRLLNGETRIASDNETANNESLIMFGTSYTEPVQMGSRKICIVLLGITNDVLADEMILSNSFSGGYSSIMHKDGSFVVKNPSVLHGGLNAYEILSSNQEASEEQLAAIRKAVQNGESYLLETQGENGQITTYQYFAPIEGTDWYIINTMPGSFIRTSVAGLQNRLTLISAIIIFVFIIAALIVLLLQASSAKKLRQSKEDLALALQAAERASESKTAFLFNMSHDIRTPMNAILGYTAIGLKHSEDRERAKDCFRKILSSGNHLLNLINDILEMSRVESGKMKITESSLDIRQAIANVDHISQSLAITKSIDYQAVVGNIRNPYIYADELHVNEVIINLISNAVKYTPDGGKVRYNIQQISDVVDGKVRFRFEISDTGIGMSEEFQTHLFESFSREENTTVSKIEGTGLGLSIVKKIVDLIGGTIHVKSKQKEGSTFTVEIPFRVMDEAAIQAFQAENVPQDQLSEGFSLKGKRALLVEDNEMNREIALDILSDTELLVDTAEDGGIALETVRSKGCGYYDFILMDVQMPVMNGYEATKAIRALPDGEKIPIIALSANAFEEDVKKSIDSGMNAHVAKPINIKALLETLEKFVK